MTDPDLVNAARGGDVVGTDALLRSIWPHAYRIAFVVLRESAAAEDAAQDALARVWATIGELHEPEAFAAWFYRIVVNSAKMQRRGADRRQVREQTFVEAKVSADEDQRIDLSVALRSLPEWLRVPIVLHYYAGLSSAEIGRVLSAPSATIRFRLALARRQLRPKLVADPEIQVALL
jgi:RNA polymerase sigma-70 factor (ECF subfamily)